VTGNARKVKKKKRQSSQHVLARTAVQSAGKVDVKSEEGIEKEKTREQEIEVQSKDQKIVSMDQSCEVS